MPNIILEPEHHVTLDLDGDASLDFEMDEYTPMVSSDLPTYTGETTVIPSTQKQTLETENTAMLEDITVEAIPYDEVEAATPVISVDNNGKVTATTDQHGGIVEASTKSAEYQQQAVEQATPTISVDNAGKITASATQAAGFVVAGTKSAAYSLPTQAAKTVTPTESAQTVVTAGKWTTGAVQVGAIPSDYIKPSGMLSIASNGTYDVARYASASVTVSGITPTGALSIGANGVYDVTSYASANVSVPGVETEALTVTENGVYTASAGHAYTPVTVNVAGGGGISVDDLATVGVTGNINLTVSSIRKLAFYSNNGLTGVNAPNVSRVNASAFDTCTELSHISFPSASVIDTAAFRNCYKLTNASFPEATGIYDRAFTGCTNLETISAPIAGRIDDSAFTGCIKLAAVNFPAATSISNSAFMNCQKLSIASFPLAEKFGGQVFRGCLQLVELHLGSVPSVPTIGQNAFSSTPIGGYSASAGRYGSVFVPASLYDSFLTAANWSSISSRIVSV